VLEHLIPQPPQLAGSEVVSMQASPQRAKPLLQLMLQLRVWQLAVPFAGTLHSTSQLPQ